MHPAFSVIFFTTSSGAGYGLLFLLGVLAPSGVLPPDRWLGLTALGLSFVTVTFGLASSTFHLGHPERAWRALTQWRTSWLSREGVAAIASFVPAGLFGLGWVVFEQTTGVWAVLGVASAALAAVTVGCTAMIYRSLKPIHQWYNGWVLPAYLVLGLMSGALWLSTLAHLFAVPHAHWVAAIALVAIAAGWGIKIGYWHYIDSTRSPATANTATGLRHGTVRLVDAPHSQENYLLKEMGFQVARKHAVKLRRIAHLFAFALPFLLNLVALLMPGSLLATACAVVAIGAATIGMVAERWLFFAEARHTVTLYYGARAA